MSVTVYRNEVERSFSDLELRVFWALWNGIEPIGKQESTRELLGPILWGVGEQVHKGT
jgi:hypothetical protein